MVFYGVCRQYLYVSALKWATSFLTYPHKFIIIIQPLEATEKWAVPPPGWQWDYLGGRCRWAPPSALFPYLRFK
jgi:hypothetical protein